MTFDLKAQPASISSAICGLRRIIIVFSSSLTNKMEKWKKKMENVQMPRTLGVAAGMRPVNPILHTECEAGHALLLTMHL